MSRPLRSQFPAAVYHVMNRIEQYLGLARVDLEVLAHRLRSEGLSSLNVNLFNPLAIVARQCFFPRPVFQRAGKAFLQSLYPSPPSE